MLNLSGINTGIVSAILGYVFIQFAIGAWFSRRMANERDYILAGRQLGGILVAFSVFATWFGAEAVQVSAGEIYAKGLSGALLDPLGYGVAVVVVGVLLAAPLWRSGVTTFADMIRERYSPSVERVFVLVLMPGSLFWAAAQIRAFGQILSSSGGVDLTSAILLAAILVGAYSVVGGLLADAVTDVIQGVAVIAGLVVLTGLVLLHFAGVSPGAAAPQIAPDRLDIFKPDEDGPIGLVEKMAVVMCGSIVSVELISRFLGASSVRAAAGGTIVGGAMYLAIGLMPVALGLVGPLVMPGLTEPEQVVPRLAEAFLPGPAYLLFLGALVSAILSVVHAALHAPAAQLSHNIVVRLMPALSTEARLWSVRLTVLVLSIVAWGLAQSVERIKDLVELASAFGSAGAIVVALMGIFSSFGGPKSALAALLSGIGVWMIGKFFLDLTTPYLIALASALAVYVTLALLEPEKKG
ncbi:MAG: hypothetical protein R3D68_19155 [Hyphomicrobiaceae bacterium]